MDVLWPAGRDRRWGLPQGRCSIGRWLLYYAALGFDVLTYKTVRSRTRACYPLPNLQPVACDALHGGETRLPATDAMHGSWAVAFGMPSQSPDVWRADVEVDASATAARKDPIGVSRGHGPGRLDARRPGGRLRAVCPLGGRERRRRGGDEFFLS